MRADELEQIRKQTARLIAIFGNDAAYKSETILKLLCHTDAIQTELAQTRAKLEKAREGLKLLKLPFIRPEKWFICKCDNCGHIDTSENFLTCTWGDDGDCRCPIEECLGDGDEIDALEFIEFTLKETEVN